MKRAHLSPDQIPALVERWCGLLGLEVQAAAAPSGDEELFPNRIALKGPDAHVLAAAKGQALDALQFLVHEAQGERDEQKLAYLDAEGLRLFRMKEVLAMGAFAAQKARELGSYTFSPMSPRERRWIHLSVAKAGDDLTTESEGTGHFKPVKVLRK
ncbi:MAG TPA: R3H domain-containing nucleic acid-binding protein [Holophagaceae bacterium]|nr:R3H domain-containing nucleic acid-binding protein [Holophagaceae bacterium]